MGLFSAECHGGARWHVGIMNRRESPFEETALLRELMPNVLLQTLIRETNLWGYRPYPKNVIEYAVGQVDIDVWRCFSFLNDVRNMRTVAEVVMKRGRLFEPTISFTTADWATNEYYLKVIRDIVDLCSGVDEIVLCVKDMAGVGDVTRIGNLISAIKQKYPTLVINYHRHITDGLAIPALLSAAKAGAQIFDVEEDSLVRFYGHSPILSVQAIFEESGIPVHLNRPEAEDAVQKVRDWIGHYEWAESPFKGLDHTVTRHKMPGGAFPSSFEQAQKAEFLHLMPAVLKLMSLYQPDREIFRCDPRLPDHLGHLQRDHQPLCQGARRRRGQAHPCAHDKVRRRNGAGFQCPVETGAGRTADALQERSRRFQEPAARQLRKASCRLAG